MLQFSGSNDGAVGCCSTQIVVGEAAYEVALGIPDSCVLAVQSLPLDSASVVEVELLGQIPIVCEVESQLVLVALVVFRSILIEVVEVGVALVGIPHTLWIGAVIGHTLVIHGGVGAIVDIVEPLVEAHSEGGVVELLVQF